MKIIYKLTLSFILIIAIYNGGLFFSLSELNKQSQSLIDSYSLNLKSVNNIRASWDEFQNARDLSQSVMRMTMLVDKAEVATKFNQYYEGFLLPLNQLLEDYDSSSWEYEDMTHAITMGEAWRQKINILLFDESATLIPTHVEMEKSTSELEVILNGLVAHVVEESQVQSQEIVSENQEVLSAITLCAIVIGIFTVFLSAFLSFSIVKPIKELGRLMVEIANGKKDVLIPYQKGGSETSSMARSLELFRINDKQRQTMVSHIESVVEHLVDESAKLGKVSNEVNLELNKQKETIQSANTNSQLLAKGLEDISSLTGTALDSAKQAALASDDANNQVVCSEKIISSSVEQVNNVFGCITKLEDGSKNIEEVIKGHLYK